MPVFLLKAISCVLGGMMSETDGEISMRVHTRRLSMCLGKAG